MEYIKNFIDKSVFGVCSMWANYLGIATSKLRLNFIYITMLTLGSPLIIYLFVAFWINIKKAIRNRYHPILD